VLVSTHDLGLVRARFTRCLTINGKVLGDGAPASELASEKLDRLFGSTTQAGQS
jgi:ABC-type Mn2+/Zn2+ transport system ATPase subunit